MFVLFRGTAGDGEVASYHGAIEAGGECEGLHVAEASFSSCAYADDGVGQDEAVDGEVAEDFKRLWRLGFSHRGARDRVEDV